MKTKSIQKSSNRTISKKSNTTYSNISPLVKSEVMGIEVTNATAEEVLEYLVDVLQNSQKNLYVVTPNPEIVLLSRKNPDLKNALNSADLAITDGMQLYRSARFLGIPLKERIIGTNFVEMVCEKVQDWPITVGFLGGGPKIAEKASECLLERFPGLKVAFVGQEWPEEQFDLGQLESRVTSHESREEIIEKKTVIRNSKFVISNIDILFVAFGAPKQELWMQEHLNKIPVRVMIGIGGALDQIANPSLRPPAWLHSLGVGFVYRLLREPWRIKRQAKLINFLRLVLKEKLS